MDPSWIPMNAILTKVQHRPPDGSIERSLSISAPEAAQRQQVRRRKAGDRRRNLRWEEIKVGETANLVPLPTLFEVQRQRGGTGEAPASRVDKSPLESISAPPQ